MTVKSRLKMAAKCLLGKEIVPKVTKHEYVLTYSDKGNLVDIRSLLQEELVPLVLLFAMNWQQWELQLAYVGDQKKKLKTPFSSCPENQKR